MVDVVMGGHVRTPVLMFERTSIASWPERTPQRCLVRDAPPPHLLVLTMRGNGFDQRCKNDAQCSSSGPRQAVAWLRKGRHTTRWVEAWGGVKVA